MDNTPDPRDYVLLSLEARNRGFRSLAETGWLHELRYVTSSVTGYDEMIWADYLNFAWHVREGKLRAVLLLATEKERTG